VKNRLTFTKITELNVDSFADGISELNRVAHKQRHDPAYWHWRYLKGPAGKGNLIIALRGNQVVGKYGLLCLSVIVKGKLVVAGLMEGLLVQPFERFWQCYRGLVERYNLESQGDNLDFSFGISHSRTLDLHKRFGVKDLGRVPVYLGFLNIPKVLEGFFLPYPLSLFGYLGQAIIGLRVSKKKVSDLNICHVKRFDSSFDKLWDNISKRHAISIIKNAEYLNWRYAESPENRCECLAAYNRKRLEGLVVFCVTDSHNGSYILELFAREDNENVMRELLLQVFRELKTKNIGYITASFSVTSGAVSVLRNLGFKPWGTKLWSTHMIISAGLQNSLCPELELKNWNFSLGDWMGY